MKTVEELLAPRYKVIAGDTSGNYKIGEIIEADTPKTNSSKFYDDYQNIFRKLSWYEERFHEDFPEYIKISDDLDAAGIHKVTRYDFGSHLFYISFDGIDDYPCFFYETIPATHEEYIQQQNK